MNLAHVTGMQSFAAAWVRLHGMTARRLPCHYRHVASDTKLIGAIATAFLTLTVPTEARQQPVRPTSLKSEARSAFPALQAFADSVVREGKVPGITLAIGRDGRPPTFISAGRITIGSSAAPAGPDTLWRVYSMTKPVTGIAAMILIDEGKIRLDQPISDFFPAFRSVRVYADRSNSDNTRPATREITVRHLLTHTAGLGYPQFASKRLGDALNGAGLVPFSFGKELEAAVRPRRPTSLIAFAERRATIPLANDPGSKFAYSMGLDLLAAVVERASGMPYERFLATRLLKPLRMHSTYWQVPAGAVERFADNVSSDRNGALEITDPAVTSPYLKPPSFPYGGAGLVMSARDYDLFLHMLQNGGTIGRKRIIGRRTAALAMSNLLPAGVQYANFGPIPRNESTGFGAGGFVTIVATDAFGRKRGTFGWDGAAGTRAWVDPERKVRVTMMINAAGGLDLIKRFEAAVAADLK